MTEHQEEAMKRVKVAHNGMPPQSSLQYHPVHPWVLDLVCCRECRVPLRGWIDDDRFDEAKEINGRTVLIRRRIFATFPDYTEAMLTFDDGSRHSTYGCRTCIRELVAGSAKDWERKYAGDLYDHGLMEARGGGAVDWLQVAYRRPVKIELVGAP